MQLYQSYFGAGLSLLYIALAVYIVQRELRSTGGCWINFHGLGVVLITLPSQVTLGMLLKKAGVPEVNYSYPGVGSYTQIILHVAVSAVLVYLLGYDCEWAMRHVWSVITAGS